MVDRRGTPTRSRGTALRGARLGKPSTRILTSPDDLETEAALPTSLSTHAAKYAVEKLSRPSASAVQALSAEVRAGRGRYSFGDALPRSGEAVSGRDMGSSIGSCKQSLQDVWPSPVGPRQGLAVFRTSEDRS